VLEALTPIMAATTLTLSLAFEQLWVVLPGSPYFDGWEHCGLTAGLIFVGAMIAFGMVWCEYEVRAVGWVGGSCGAGGVWAAEQGGRREAWVRGGVLVVKLPTPPTPH